MPEPAFICKLIPAWVILNSWQEAVHHNTVNVRSMVVGHSDADPSRFGFEKGRTDFEPKSCAAGRLATPEE